MRSRWLEQRERGSSWLLRFMVWYTLTLGWHAARVLLYPITLYFLLFSPKPRAASRRYLERALRRRATALDLFRHYFAFSSTILDRAFLLTGRLRGYDIEIIGLETLRRRIAEGRGCILLGSHLGSFEVLRAVGDACPVPVNAVMYEENALRANAIFAELNPQRSLGVIPLGGPEAMLRVKECIDAGEVVGFLGDRIVEGEKTVTARFLGLPAAFPAGPMILSHLLRAPIILFFGIYRGGRRYEVHFEEFADRLVLDRAARERELAHWAQRYADRLEAHCLAHPYNWFNFYDYWGENEGATPSKPDADWRGARGEPGTGWRTVLGRFGFRYR
jgi:hypothetical protein